MEAVYSRDEKQRMRRTIRTVESTGPNSGNCFLAFWGKEAFYYKLARSFSVLPPPCRRTSRVVHSKLIRECAKCAQGWGQSSTNVQKWRHCTIRDPDPHRTILGQVMSAFHRWDRRWHAHSIGASNWPVQLSATPHVSTGSTGCQV